MMPALSSWATLVEAQIKLLLRNRLALVGSLGLAVVSMLIFGSLLGGTGAPPLAICVVDADGSPASAQLAAAFRASDAISDARCVAGDEMDQLRQGRLAAVVALPAGF